MPNNQLSKIWLKIKSFPKKYTIPTVVMVGLLLLYGVIFLSVKPVVASYSEPACTRYLTLLPDLHQETSQEGYDIKPAGTVHIGGVAIAATERCFVPTESPEPGTTEVSLAPFRGWFMSKTFAVDVDSPPVADLSQLNRPISATLPLDIPLSVTDKTFDYQMQANGNRVACKSKTKATSCDLESLELSQGKTYTIELIRQFEGQTVASLAKAKATTLPATRVTESSIDKSETVYAKPRTINLEFDKVITEAEVGLYELSDDERQPVGFSQAIDGKKLKLSLDEDLTRSTKHQLVVESVVAKDGSGLEKPYKLNFNVSGGPKVKSINVGRTGVSTDTAVITFDQALLDDQDLSQAVGVSGGAEIAGQDGKQLFVSLTGVKRCQDFSIRINDKLNSKYKVTGGSKWQFSGRKVCHTVSPIGYSSQGRPINAYYFGDGKTTIMYTGAIHGSEGNTQSLMLRWIDYLEANARDIPSNKRIVVVPTVNPDGLATGSRTNARNVDLNRNFATSDWQKDITTVGNKPFKGGGGRAAMSESETKAIAALASQLRPRLILSYHSVGGMVAANQAGDSSGLAGTYSRLTGYRNITGQSESTFEYAISGTADDYYAEKLGVPSLLIELGTTYYHEFERNRSAMWAMVKL